MNYLAHSYLSFGEAAVLTGNMISDFIKGRKQYDYPPDIFSGIVLHRRIDAFTDAHPATREAAAILKPAAGRYAAAFADVVYDHFLALDTNQFANEQALKDHATFAYQSLTTFEHLLPERFALMLPSMKQHNWLYHYRYVEGIEKSFAGIARRAAYIENTSDVYKLFLTEYQSFRDCYYNFFPEIWVYAKGQFDELRQG